MESELLVVIVVEAADGNFLDGPVHALDLAGGPRTALPGQRAASPLVLNPESFPVIFVRIRDDAPPRRPPNLQPSLSGS